MYYLAGREKAIGSDDVSMPFQLSLLSGGYEVFLWTRFLSDRVSHLISNSRVRPVIFLLTSKMQIERLRRPKHAYFFYFKQMFLSFPMFLSFETAVTVFIALEIIFTLDFLSLIIDPRYVN